MLRISPGEKLKKIRMLQKLSQEQLAQQTGITQTNLSKIERGKSPLGKDRAIRMAKVLNVHPAEILFPEIQRVELPPSPQSPQATLQKEEKDIR